MFVFSLFYVPVQFVNLLVAVAVVDVADAVDYNRVFVVVATAVDYVAVADVI